MLKHQFLNQAEVSLGFESTWTQAKASTYSVFGEQINNPTEGYIFVLKREGSKWLSWSLDSGDPTYYSSLQVAWDDLNSINLICLYS